MHRLQTRYYNQMPATSPHHRLLLVAIGGTTTMYAHDHIWTDDNVEALDFIIVTNVRAKKRVLNLASRIRYEKQVCK